MKYNRVKRSSAYARAHRTDEEAQVLRRIQTATSHQKVDLDVLVQISEPSSPAEYVTCVAASAKQNTSQRNPHPQAAQDARVRTLQSSPSATQTQAAAVQAHPQPSTRAEKTQQAKTSYVTSLHASVAPLSRACVCHI